MFFTLLMVDTLLVVLRVINGCQFVAKYDEQLDKWLTQEAIQQEEK